MIQFISGTIFAAGTAVLTYYGKLALHRTKISTISGVGVVGVLAWLQKNWTTLAIPNPAMYYGLSGLPYVDEILAHRDRFRYRRIAALNNGHDGFPLTSKWASTYSNFTVGLLNIAKRYINQNVIPRDVLLALLQAHIPLDTTFMPGTTDPRTEQPYLLWDPSTMLAQFLYTLARQPSLHSR